MSYNIRYRLEFSSIADVIYTLNISKKDYTGPVENIKAAGTPVVQEWLTDNPKEPVRGCSLTVRYLNKDGLHPLTMFISEEDDTFLFDYSCISPGGFQQSLFKGYLIQDDCRESMVDETHEISLTATDGLGLLKDITLDEAARSWGPTTEYDTLISHAPGTTIFIHEDILNFPVQIGDRLIISGTGDVYDTTVTVLNVQDIPALPFLILTTSPEIPQPAFSGITNCHIVLIKKVDLNTFVSLAQLVRLCLLSTGATLNTRLFSNIIETVTTTGRMLEDTYVRGDTFLNSNDWKNCYDVLSYIFFPFRLTLFQAEGYWNIVRWDELAYYSKDINGFQYNSEMGFVGAVTLNNEFITGFQEPTYPLSAPEKSILRPYKFVKETFNYVQPANLLLNSKLDILGAFIASNVVGGDTEYDYEFSYWFNGPFAAFPSRFIRVTINNLTGLETSRKVVTKGLTGDSARSVKSTGIEVEKGDKITYSYSFKTIASQPGPANILIGVAVYDGTNTYYLQGNNTWSTIAPGFSHQVATGDNTNEWQSVSVFTNAGFPVSGILFVYLNHTHDTPNASDTTFIRDISLEYYPYINDSIKIIGQTHTQRQNLKIKNVDNTEIYIDDSPRSSIAGTMFLSSYTGVLRDKTLLWSRGFGSNARLGELVTHEQLFWRRKSRTKIEGTFYGLIQNDVSLSPLTLFTYTQLPLLYFVAGSMAIDYRFNNVRMNMWEMIDSAELAGESDNDLNSFYEFKYLYK